MNTKSFTNLKTSRAISEVVDIESEVVWHKHKENDFELLTKEESDDERENMENLRPLAFYKEFTVHPALTFTDCLKVIEKIGDSLDDVNRKQHKLLDMLYADKYDMSKEGGEVEKLLMELIK